MNLFKSGLIKLKNFLKTKGQEFCTGFKWLFFYDVIILEKIYEIVIPEIKYWYELLNFKFIKTINEKSIAYLNFL